MLKVRRPRNDGNANPRIVDSEIVRSSKCGWLIGREVADPESGDDLTDRLSERLLPFL